MLCTVRDGHAVKHKVSLLAQNSDECFIAGEGISAGDSVVIVGNYELEDGMSVQIATTQPATTGWFAAG